MAERILIVEDEDNIADILHEYLIHDGFTTHRLQRGDEVLPWLLTNRAPPADLVLLDLMLPGQSGFEVCRALRANSATRSTAIIITTARIDEAARLLGREKFYDVKAAVNRFFHIGGSAAARRNR